jgi:hypothetical protein
VERLVEHAEERTELAEEPERGRGVEMKEVVQRTDERLVERAQPLIWHG